MRNAAYSSTTPTPYPYTTTNPYYPTTHGPYPTTTHAPYPTYTTTPYYPTTYPPKPTTVPPPTEHCYGHFIYKEEHNIIVDGEDDKHKGPYECEYACTMITECRFWKFTMSGEHAGYCELNRGTPLNHGEVVGQRNVKLVETQDGKGPYCWFPPNNHSPHHQQEDENNN